MRWLLGCLLFAMPALAQQPPTPEQQAMGATILECVQSGVALRTQIFTLQAQIDKLKADAAKPAAEPAK